MLAQLNATTERSKKNYRNGNKTQPINFKYLSRIYVVDSVDYTCLNENIF